MELDGLHSTLLKHFNGSKLRLEWPDGLVIVGTLDTAFETDNGLEISDEGYMEYYACTIVIREIPSSGQGNLRHAQLGGLMEISIQDPPSVIKNESGYVIWSQQ